jgi:hypothetical protein
MDPITNCRSKFPDQIRCTFPDKPEAFRPAEFVRNSQDHDPALDDLRLALLRKDRLGNQVLDGPAPPFKADSLNWSLLLEVVPPSRSWIERGGPANVRYLTGKAVALVAANLPDRDAQVPAE